MAQSPETATIVGLPGLNDRWTDDSPAGIEDRRRHLSEAANRLGSFDPATLSPRERLNHRLYANLLKLAQVGIGYGNDALPFHFGWPRSLYVPMHQMEGIHLTAGQLLPMQPRARVEDVEAIIARLRALPTAIEQNRALLQAAVRNGIVPPKIAIRGLPAQVAALVPDVPESSAMFEPFREMPETVPAAEKTRLTEVARTVYSRSVRPAFLELHRYLVDEYLPAARATIGMSDLPNGRAMYDHRVRWTTTTEQTAEQIHAIGLAEVARIRAAMEALMRSTGFAGSIPEFYAFLKSDARFRARSAEELIEGFRALAKRIDPQLARRFGTLPRLPYGVDPVPDFSAPSSPGAYYQSGAPSVGRPGMFYANTYDLPSRTTWRMEALTLHEAVPGHHLQIAIAEEMEDVPEFRKHSGETAFVEGWGLYAESLGEELGLYKDPYARFGGLDFDMWRSIRLVVDTGMHALGWTRDRALEFFRENTGMGEVDVAVEVDRYIMVPGQALAYKIGQLKIRELRTFAEGALGSRFDERSFHDTVLGEGGLPLGELEARVRAWVDRVRSAPTAAT
jgi:uncharacterized protein (DUF885 family)